MVERVTGLLPADGLRLEEDDVEDHAKEQHTRRSALIGTNSTQIGLSIVEFIHSLHLLRANRLSIDEPSLFSYRENLKIASELAHRFPYGLALCLISGRVYNASRIYADLLTRWDR